MARQAAGVRLVRERNPPLDLRIRGFGLQHGRINGQFLHLSTRRMLGARRHRGTRR